MKEAVRSKVYSKKKILEQIFTFHFLECNMFFVREKGVYFKNTIISK